MGLTFSVGNPDAAFIQPLAERVRSTLASHFGTDILLDSDEETFYSNELAWSGWSLLQEKATEVVGSEKVPHLLAMEAWSGCYVPTNTQIGSFGFDGESTKLDVASLPELLRELELLGPALGLPIDDPSLCKLAEKYQDDDLIDDDMEIQTYAQLLLAAHLADRRRQVLWVVK